MTQVLPDWVIVLSALLTPTIAIAGIVIAYRQSQTAEKKRTQDLFDKRFAVFESARILLGVVLSHGKPSQDDLRTYALSISGAAFLFNDDLASYLKEIGERAAKLNAGEVLAERLPDGNPQRGRAIDVAHNHAEWLLNQAEDLEAKFTPFLRVT